MSVEETKIEMNNMKGGKQMPEDSSESAQKLKIMRAASQLGVASIALAGEAVMIFISSNVNQPLDQLDGTDVIFPPGLKLSAAACECAVFAFGLFMTLLSTWFDINVPSLTYATLGISFICSAFFFFVVIIAEPIFNWDKDLVGGANIPIEPAGGWDTEFRQEVTYWLGYFIPQMCVALMALGFQLSSLYNLYRCQSSARANDEPKYDNLRYLYYSFLVFWVGIGILTVSAWTLVQEGPERLPSPVVYPPTLIAYPGPAVLSGIAVVAYGLVNMLYGLWLMHTGEDIFLITVFLQLLSIGAYIYLFGIHTLMQVSLIAPSLAGVGVQVTLLLIPVVFAPVYYMGSTIRALQKVQH
mmetsp:Transcript_12571/g.17425  ORF Transcript_12571/g.17425 Transcript_12571/m.17425 type:complete len:355 (+) Transcript_12571:216-1280(+)|eukprot:CAMPEP_0184478542 /NCGR_PEP_ID=MMETSP0113_2-20130426/538_1 /TAXON_ID=91329 /ORGANISM="Norrisiella sphaerica, Strain BC52" /LENGTH=354 /DNA_ID=CAMNT_0026856373 /DNA_START=221 /DNA_END=1285 /DNA_ORIENTATION=+